MNFYETIKNYPRQFEYEPKIIGELPKSSKYFVISGMGGSHLAGDILRSFLNNIFIHKNYGLPNLPKEILKDSLMIALSHSGNTEETIDFFESARKIKLKVIALSTNGKLLELAKKYRIPYIQLPGKDIQPRLALGYHLMTLLKIISPNLFSQFKKLSQTLNVQELEKLAKKILPKLKNKIPLIYTSEKNEFLAYNLKIKFNETSKIAAFYNVFPELNHNEIEGVNKKNFTFIFLYDKKDDQRIKKRMRITEKILRKKSFDVIKIEIKDIFSLIVLGDFLTYFLAQFYNKDPEKVEIIKKIKDLIKDEKKNKRLA